MSSEPQKLSIFIASLLMKFLAQILFPYLCLRENRFSFERELTFPVDFEI